MLPNTDLIAHARISSLTGEFVDPDMERGYQNVHWTEQARQIRMVLVVSIFAYLFASYQNYLDLGEGGALWTIGVVRSAVFVFYGWAIVETFAPHVSFRAEGIIFIAEVMTGLSEAVETIAYHKAGFVINLISAPFLAFIILIFYAFIHIRWSLTTLASFIGGTCVVAGYAYIAQGHLLSIIRHPVMIIGCIVIGAAVVRSMNRLHRHDWQQGKKLETEILERRRAEKKALEASRVKGEFLAVMSHEIRTPLNSILAMTEVMSADVATQGERMQRQLGILDTAGKHLHELVDDILDFSRLEANVNLPACEPFDLRFTVGRATTTVQNLARKKGLELVVAIDGNLPNHFMGDAQGIRRILINLIGNAIKFTDEGRVDVGVRWSKELAGALQFSVSDTGIGIAEEDLTRIFEPFQQLDSSATRQYQGTGLGLAISHKLVQQMGGVIQARQRETGGTVFEFTLPLAVAQDMAAHDPQPQESQSVAAPSMHFKALLVEDSELNRMVVEEYLAGVPCELQWAENGRQGLEAFRYERFDIVLMDLQMPEMDGISATLLMRQWEQEQGLTPTPILIISADSLNETRQRATAAGASGYITKPISRAELFGALNQHIQLGIPGSSDPDHFRTLLQPLLPRFFTQMRHDIEAMARAIDKSELKVLAGLAHAAKGHSQMFGFPQLAKCAAELENAAKSATTVTPPLHSGWEALRTSFDALAHSSDPGEGH